METQEKKKIVLNGKDYRVSPYEFVYEQGKYYIMCQNHEEEETGMTRNYRIDLTTKIKVTNTKRAEYPFEENITDYCIKQLNMYAADNQDIVLEVDALGLRGLYDKLGLNITTMTSIRESIDELKKIKHLIICILDAP